MDEASAAQLLPPLNLQRNEGPKPPTKLPRVDPREYPDASVLRGAIAAWIGRSPEEVVVTAGGDDAIDRVMRTFAGPGSRVVVADPTFEMIPSYAQMTRAQVVRVPWTDEFPLAQFQSLDAEVFVFVTPDNPSGRSIEWSVVEDLARTKPDAIVLLDQAYLEFGPEDFTDRARQFPNIVVVRTFSKAWGLAGMRVGYAVAEPAVAARLSAMGSPYPVTSASCAIALACLQDSAYVDAHVQRVRAERDQLASTLRELGAVVSPSEANFVFARIADAPFVVRALASLGILVRAFERPGLEDAIRITCPGDETQFQRLLRALRTVMAPEALLFDMDGVLADVSRSYREAIVRTCASFDVWVSADQVTAEKRKPGSNDDFQVTHRLLAAADVEVSIGEVEKRFQTAYDGGLWRSESLLLSASVLRGLGDKHRLAVVTGRPRPDALRFLRAHDIEDVFSTLVCREDAPLKPNPAPVRKALQTLGCATAWMFGDTVDDARAARDAGVLSIGVAAPGEFTEMTRAALQESGALTTVENLAEVTQWLR